MQKKIMIFLSVIFVMLTTVAYSALSTSLSITSEVKIRPISDIRVDGIVLSGSTLNGAEIKYESEYNVDKITSGFVLPNSNSSITYKVTIANNGDFDQTIYNMTTTSNDNGLITTIKYANGTIFNFKDVIEKKSTLDLYVTYTTTNPSTSTINVTNVFDFRKVYYITYQENGGSSVTDQIKYEGEDLTLNLVNNVLEEPVKEGYTFSGWTDEQNGTRIKYRKGDKLTVDLNEYPIYTLYAIYTTDIYTITFDPNNGEEVITKRIEYNTSYGELPTVSKTGYTFDGWYTSNDVKVTPETLAKKSETITAHWIANTYTITLNKNGATNNPTASVEVTYDAADINPEEIVVPQKEYTVSGFELSNSRKSNGATVSSNENLTTSYSFNGWYTLQNGGDLMLDNTNKPVLTPSINEYTDEESNWIHDEDITLFARFSGSGNITLPTIEKTGYTCGWTANENGTTIQHTSGETITPITDVALYGVCEPISYTIEYTLNGGSATNPTSYTKESSAITLNNPKKTGYLFDGWTGSNGNTPSKNVTIPTGSTGNRSYTANWTYVGNDPESVIKILNTEGEGISTTDHENELRFIGSNPDNYVRFNNQIWRIIGVFDGRLKLVQSPIGSYSFDTSAVDVNKGYGVNQWGESTLTDGTDYDGADLMKLLNPGYESNQDLRCIAGSTLDSTNSIVNCGDNSASNYDTVSVNNSLYWNAGSGKCYTYGNYNTANCDFTNTGLSDTASKNMIDNATWYLGSLDTPSANIWDGRVTASLLYSWERSSSTGKQCSNATHCSDTVNRTTRWTGKVGLIYPSDYAYATSGGSTHDRDACLSYTVGYVSDSSIPNWQNTYTDCKNNDWLLNTGVWTWTLSPRAISSDSNSVFYVHSTGYVISTDAFFAGSVRPVVYLKSGVTITSGDGTQSKPFVLTDPTSDTYSVKLDNRNATTTGTTSIYEKYNTGYYLNSEATTQITTSSNGITIPTKKGYAFGGYYTGKNGTGTKVIDSSGKLSSQVSATIFTDNSGVLYAKWTRVMAENIEHINSTLGCSNVQCMIDKLYEMLN